MQQVQTYEAVQAAPAIADTRLQVLMVGLGNEIFAIETDLVREIIDPVPVTLVAGARSFLQALINVRGNVIPLADLRLRFGMTRTQQTVAPAGTPAPIVERLNAAAAKAITAPEIAAKLEASGLVPAPGSPSDMARLVNTDVERFGRLIRELDIKVSE